MDRDFETSKHGYTSWSYLEVLDSGLGDIHEDGMISMQDKARIHTSRQSKEWFENHGILLLDWPPYSPEMNPIENLWAIVKRIGQT